MGDEVGGSHLISFLTTPVNFPDNSFGIISIFARIAQIWILIVFLFVGLFWISASLSRVCRRRFVVSSMGFLPSQISELLRRLILILVTITILDFVHEFGNVADSKPSHPIIESRVGIVPDREPLIE